MKPQPFTIHLENKSEEPIRTIRLFGIDWKKQRNWKLRSILKTTTNGTITITFYPKTKIEKP